MNIGWLGVFTGYLLVPVKSEEEKNLPSLHIKIPRRWRDKNLVFLEGLH